MEMKSWNDADRAMEALKTADAKLRALAAEKDKESALIERRYNVRLTELSESIEEITATLKKFAQAHKSEFKPAPKGDGRSYEHAGVEFGFQRTPPAVFIESEAPAIVWLRNNFANLYIRVREEANREGLLDALKAGDERFVEKLAANGIMLKQRDKFFCETANSE